MTLAHTVPSLNPPPDQGHSVCSINCQWAGHSHCKIKTWRLEFAVVGVIQIVQHIDAAAKNNALVHHTQLAVQPAPVVWHQQAQPPQASPQRRIHTPLYASLPHFLLPLQRQGV